MTNKIMPMSIEIDQDDLQIIEEIMAHISKDKEKWDRLRDELKEEVEEFERAYIYDGMCEEKEDPWKIVIDM